jgi:hypothetical protein
MSKLILLSVLLAMVLLPALAARDPDSERGFRRTVVRMMAFFAVYAFALRYLWTPTD